MTIRSGRRRWLLPGLAVFAAAGISGVVWVHAAVRTPGSKTPVLTATRLAPIDASRPEILRVLLRSPGDQIAVTAFLREAGFRIVNTGLHGRLRVVEGSAGTVARSLGARLYSWRTNATRQTYVAPDATPQLPGALATRITAIFGLNSSMRAAPALPALPKLNRFPHQLSAAQIQTAYNVKPLLDAGTNGSGIRVAIYVEGGFNKQDALDFATNETHDVLDLNVYALDTYGNYLSAVYDPSQPSQTCDTCRQEALQDIDAVHAVAPGAPIDAYELPPEGANNSFTSNLLTFMDQVGANHDEVASISLSDCEILRPTPGSPGFSNQELDGLDSVFQASLVSIFASSGDFGATCLSHHVVEFPASDPYVTGVGGTSLSLDGADHIAMEQAWDYDSTDASGGGTSGFFPRPCWQTGLGIPSGPNRLVPDVAADADYTTGLQMNGGAVASGTSLSAPLWAGVAALFDQYARGHGDVPLGLANPTIYRMASGQSNRPLYDVTIDDGKNSDLATPLPQKGWDASTGFGSFNAWTFIHDGVTPTFSPPCHPAPAPATPTHLITFDPWAFSGLRSGQDGPVLHSPAPGLVVTSTITGTCVDGSSQDPGRAVAYACGLGSGPEDEPVCFTANDNRSDSQLLCSTDPTQRGVTLLELDPSTGLSSIRANHDDPNALPWVLVLSDGSVCFTVQTDPRPNWPYVCRKSSPPSQVFTAEASPPDRSKPTWSVKECLLPEGSLPLCDRSDVTAAIR